MDPRPLLLALALAGCEGASPPASTTRPKTIAWSPSGPGVAPSAPPVDAPGPLAPGADPLEGRTPAATAANRFAAALWGKVSTTPGNLAFSPVSAWAALAMTGAGARGETAAELGRVLGLGDDPGAAAAGAAGLLDALRSGAGAGTLRIANRLFGEASSPVDPAFVELTRALFHAPFDPLDFRGAPEEARGRINAWVEGETEHRIRDLLPPRSITAETRLVLTNAVFFLARWADPFLVHLTSPDPFHPSPEETTLAPTMHQTGHFAFAAVDGVRLLHLPYEGSSLGMTFVLPDAVDGLPAVESRLAAGALDGWLAALTPQRVAVSLPRFTLDPPTSLALRPPLEALGMPLAFDRDRADFTGIAAPPNPADRLYVGEVFHKAFVKVDEQGTEAAAATAVVMPRAGSAPPTAPPAEFRADHPFLFVLRDTRTGVVLFLGRVVSPESAREP